MENSTATSQARRFQAVLLIFIAAYLITHLGNLGRELSYEEGIFLTPGLNLFTGKAFEWTWGELVPHASAFHKPPLLSLLLGTFAQLSPDPVVGARLVPFFCALFALVGCAVATRTVIPGLILLVSPLCFAASVHIQTDGTVGVLGYTMLVLGIFYMLGNLQRRTATLWIWGGMVVLWVGKLEIAVIGTGVCLGAAVLADASVRRYFVVQVILAAVAGFLLLCLLCLPLARSANLSFESAMMELTGTVSRITQSGLEAQSAKPLGISPGRRALLEALARYDFWQTCSTLLVPSALLLGSNWKALAGSWRLLLCLFGAGLAPIAAYLTVGFPGDGYPRYFVWGLFAWALLLGWVWVHSRAPWTKLVAAAVILLGVAAVIPKWEKLMRGPGHPASPQGAIGYRDSAALLLATSQPDAILIAPEPASFYLPDRKIYVVDSFDPYPQRHATVRQNPAPSGGSGFAGRGSIPEPAHLPHRNRCLTGPARGQSSAHRDL